MNWAMKCDDIEAGPFHNLMCSKSEQGPFHNLMCSKLEQAMCDLSSSIAKTGK